MRPGEGVERGGEPWLRARATARGVARTEGVVVARGVVRGGVGLRGVLCAPGVMCAPGRASSAPVHIRCPGMARNAAVPRSGRERSCGVALARRFRRRDSGMPQWRGRRPCSGAGFVHRGVLCAPGRASSAPVHIRRPGMARNAAVPRSGRERSCGVALARRRGWARSGVRAHWRGRRPVRGVLLRRALVPGRALCTGRVVHRGVICAPGRDLCTGASFVRPGAHSAPRSCLERLVAPILPGTRRCPEPACNASAPRSCL